jgi:hypothetical protein
MTTSFSLEDILLLLFFTISMAYSTITRIYISFGLSTFGWVGFLSLGLSFVCFCFCLFWLYYVLLSDMPVVEVKFQCIPSIPVPEISL